MKEKNKYKNLRLRELKKHILSSKNSVLLKRKYKWDINGSMPILESHHRFDPWVMWLQGKIFFDEL